MAGQLRHTMVVRNPDTLEAVALLEGSELPDWATDLVHEDNLTTGDDAPGGEAASGYSGKEWTKATLEAEVESRNKDRADDAQIKVEEPGNKAELVAALEADDNTNSA